MGASLILRRMDGGMDANAVSKALASLVRDCERRDAYSGDWNTLQPRCSFPKGETPLADFRAAEEYIADNAQKWEGAVAVRYNAVDKRQRNAVTFNGKKVAGVGSALGLLDVVIDWHSDRAIKSLIHADQLTAEEKPEVERLYRELYKAERLANGPLREKVGADEMRRRWDARDAAKRAWHAYADPIVARLYATDDVASVKWLVGGWAAE
jgi:hypothetical protein